MRDRSAHSASTASPPGIKGTTLGHEFTGTVAEVGSKVRNFKPGDAVLVDPHTDAGAVSNANGDFQTFVRNSTSWSKASGILIPLAFSQMVRWRVM